MSFLKKHWQLFAIFLLALIIRTWDLDKTPSGFHVDEAKVGWNAYSLLKTGADDWGNKFPLHYNTFGDFRPTGIIYLTVPSIAIFGLNEFAVRFPGAIAGALTVVVLYFFIKELLNERDTKFNILNTSFFTALVLALSPWHITLSRATSEAVPAILFTLTGLWLLVLGLKKGFTPVYLSTCLLSLLASYSLYHSARLLVPLFATTVLAYVSWLDYLKNPKVSYLSHLGGGRGTTRRCLALVLCAILFLTTILFSLSPSAHSRLNQVSIFTDLDVKYELDKMPFEDGPNNILVARIFHNKVVTYSKHFVNEYSRYFSADFSLRPKVAKPGRYQTVGMGTLTYVELALFIFGLIYLIKKPSPLRLVLVLLLLAPLPAAITTEDTPNLSRASYMIPFIAAISGYGLWKLSKTKVYRFLLFTFYFLLSLNFIYFLHMYFIHNRVGGSMSRNEGVQDLVEVLKREYLNYDKIYLTDIPDNLYPWIAFYNKLDPKSFNHPSKNRDKGPWTYEKYNFVTARCPSRDVFNEPGKILAVDADACEAQTPPGAEMLEHIKRPDETVVYTLWSRE